MKRGINREAREAPSIELRETEPARHSGIRMQGVLTVIGGICIHLMIGNLYLWGNITDYVISYYYHLGDPHALPANAVIIIPLSYTTQSFFNPVGAYF